MADPSQKSDASMRPAQPPHSQATATTPAQPAATPAPAPPQESFVGEGITPEDGSFSTAAMATGAPGLPGTFSWRGRQYSVLRILDSWKEAGDCRHGSGERYVRKHWFRIHTTDRLEMKLYFERQRRSSGGTRWRLYSVRCVA